MTLLKYMLKTLKESNVIRSDQELSIYWCGKNRNWAACQNHSDHDLSSAAAINCLARTRQKLDECTDPTNHIILTELEYMLRVYLRYAYRIAEIAPHTSFIINSNMILTPE